MTLKKMQNNIRIRGDWKMMKLRRMAKLAGTVCLCIWCSTGLSVLAHEDVVMDVPHLRTESPKFAKMPTEPPETLPAEKTAAACGKKIVINTASRILTVYEGNTKVAMYPVGVGTVQTPTPVGEYAVETREINPTWVDPADTKVQVPSGPDNPLGYRWIGFHNTYGIHGTNRPDTIGGYVSNGCVRMHEEDVEAVYDMVQIGTPVDVYYDRIVIDSAPDHTVSYYIYPDGYSWQPLSIAAVKHALSGYGVDTFAGITEISQKIMDSDGEPTYIAKAYDLYVNGKKLPMRALKKDGITYIPAVAVATALSLDLRWNGETGILTSPYGQAPGIVKSDIVYISSSGIYTLFHLRGGLDKDLVYRLHGAA